MFEILDGLIFILQLIWHWRFWVPFLGVIGGIVAALSGWPMVGITLIVVCVPLAVWGAIVSFRDNSFDHVV
jgi:hypothetical protein